MGSYAGCNIAGRFSKKRVTPLPSFSLESSQIAELNGTYNIGHEFILNAGAINVDDQIIVRIIDSKRFDILDFDIENTGDGNAYFSINEDSLGKYAKITFDRVGKNILLESFILDNYINDYVTLFKLKTV